MLKLSLLMVALLIAVAVHSHSESDVDVPEQVTAAGSVDDPNDLNDPNASGLQPLEDPKQDYKQNIFFHVASRMECLACLPMGTCCSDDLQEELVLTKRCVQCGHQTNERLVSSSGGRLGCVERCASALRPQKSRRITHLLPQGSRD